MPRDNLLNSACLELFEYIKREGVKQLITHLVEMYRERLMRISYVNTFQALVLKYEQLTSGYPMVNGDQDSFTTQEGTPQRMVNGRQSFAGLKEMDGDEEAYFEGGDEDIDDESLPTSVMKHGLVNGASPVRPLVNYPDEDDEEGMDILASSPDPPLRDQKSSSSSSDDQRTLTDPSDGPLAEPMDEDTTSPTGTLEGETSRGRSRIPVSVEGSPGRQSESPPEPVLAKRRREEDDDDELGKMMGGVKRRSSTASLRSNASNHNSQVDGASSMNLRSHQSEESGENGRPVAQPLQQQQQPHGHGHGNAHVLRRKGSLKVKNEASSGSHKFTIKPISLSATKSQASHPPTEEESSRGAEQVENKESDDSGGEGG